MKFLKLRRRCDNPRGFRRLIRGVEVLEARRLLAIDITLSGTEVSFVGDAEFSALELSVGGTGLLTHNVTDGSLNSFVDLDGTLAGDQTLAAAEATLIAIDLSAAGGPASITGIDSGAITFAGGGLSFNWQALTADSTTTFAAGGFTRTSGAASLALTFTVPPASELGLVYGDGADSIDAGAFGAAINATTNGGDDSVIGTSQFDSIFLGAGNDFADGGEGDDFLGGDEQFVSGDDILVGGAGDDFLYGGWGEDELFGGPGFDTASEDLFDGTFFTNARRLVVDGFLVLDHGLESFFVNGTPGDDSIDVARAAGRCVVFGDAGDDTIVGSNQADDLSGGEGDDTISGRDGDDFIDGWVGSDTIQGGDGNDTIFGGPGADDLKGNSGSDFVRGGEDDDRVEGNSGDDDLNGEAGSDAVFGGDGNDALSEDADPTGLGDELHGGGGDDVLSVFGGVNTLRGDGGNDTILAGDHGIDDIVGGGGNDLIQASLDDTFTGGAGLDVLALATPLVTARITNQTITLNGVARARAGIENFSLFANESALFDAGGYTAGSVNFVGSQADDFLIGSEQADSLLGGGGTDSIFGNAGADILRGDDADDTVLGGAGIDDFGFFGLPDPTSLDRQQILDLLFSLGVVHDIADDEPLAALIS